MTTTTEASTGAVRSRMGVTVVVGDDAQISVGHFTDHPSLGNYQVTLDTGAVASVYLTETQARALYEALMDAILAAKAVSA